MIMQSQSSNPSTTTIQPFGASGLATTDSAVAIARWGTSMCKTKTSTTWNARSANTESSSGGTAE